MAEMVPWLHTFTEAVKFWPGSTLAGASTALTTRSDRSPTPSRPSTWMLLSSRSSCSMPVVSTMAAR